MVTDTERILKLSMKRKKTGGSDGYSVYLPVTFAKVLNITLKEPYVYRQVEDFFGCPILVFYPYNVKKIPFSITSDKFFGIVPDYFKRTIVFNYRTGDVGLKYPIHRINVSNHDVDKMFENLPFGSDKSNRYVKMTIDMSVPCIRLIPYNKQ